MKNIKINSVNNQNGAVLIVALIMLLVMTIAGITTMSGATLQERMAGNARQKSIAKINAEAALRSAENSLRVLNIRTSADVNTALTNAANGGYISYPIASANPFPAGFDVNDGNTWFVQDDAASFEPTDITITAPGANPPRYIIEYIGRYLEGDARDEDAVVEVGSGKKKPESTAFAFRITSIGWGQDANVYSILQSIFITAQG